MSPWPQANHRSWRGEDTTGVWLSSMLRDTCSMIFLRIFVYIYIYYRYMHIHMYMHIYACIYIYIYVSIYKGTNMSFWSGMFADDFHNSRLVGYVILFPGGITKTPEMSTQKTSGVGVSVCMEVLPMTLVLALARSHPVILGASWHQIMYHKLDGILRKSPKGDIELWFSFWFVLSHVPFIWVNLMILHQIVWYFPTTFHTPSRPQHLIHIVPFKDLSVIRLLSWVCRRNDKKHPVFANCSTITIITTFSTTPSKQKYRNATKIHQVIGFFLFHPPLSQPEYA